MSMYNIDDLLQNYRRSFEEERGVAKVESRQGPADEMDGRAPMEQEAVAPANEWEALPEREFSLDFNDPRISGDQEHDMEQYKDFLSNDPKMQEYGPAMEGMLDEIIAQMQNPEMPMDENQAKATFSQMMVEKFGSQFQ